MVKVKVLMGAAWEIGGWGVGNCLSMRQGTKEARHSRDV